MNGSESAQLVWYLLALVLVGSALLSRRIPLRGVLGMALLWVAIFGGVLFLASQRHNFSTVAANVSQQVKEKTGILSDQKETGGGRSVRISMASDGHFWADAKINGNPARFLIDSGATISAISDTMARRVGLNVDNSGPGVMMQTANGVVTARRSSIAGLTIGSISTNDLPVVVSDRFGEVNILGMNFLSRLKSWRVENNEMILEQ